ncbi:exported hypothetical protein [Luteimonas sp. 9C]|uniref:hypothetical protein n=1 Tax=Luteimonas sp. 9C TaxID=2653148 RepID=UPI0012F0D86A|nr:hypothetical protein [Luteimonas sp. 9C]VXA94885.1 exported hypothetical protein [Luteimonas sp. 9C]
MSSFASKAFIVVAALAAAACAPDRSDVEESAAAPAAEAAAAPQAATPPAVVEEAQAIPGRQVALLGAVVDIPFEHRQVYDRVRPGPNDVPERQIGLASASTDHKALAAELESALKLAGFETRTNESKDEWVWITVSSGAGQAKVAVRPDSKKPESVIVFKIPQS